MIFKRLATEWAQFNEDTIEDISDMLKMACSECNGPSIEYDLNDMTASPNAQAKKKQIPKKRREQHLVIKDFVLALGLCHNVTPTFPDPTDPEYKELQASSPDEVAMVKFADSLSMDLLGREELYIKMRNAAGIIEEYDILANFPFSSETKRMGIILKHRESQKIIFYLKGAETVMEEKVKPNYRTALRESCEALAMDGLRTLVISQKLLTVKEYEEFNKKLQAARAELYNRDAQVQAVIESMEEGMEYLGVTGVEDKLQEDVMLTIENLRSAGI